MTRPTAPVAMQVGYLDSLMYVWRNHNEDISHGIVATLPVCSFGSVQFGFDDSFDVLNLILPGLPFQLDCQGIWQLP